MGYQPLLGALVRMHRRDIYGSLVAMSEHVLSDRPNSQLAAQHVVGLYRRAFAEFGGRALWNIREVKAVPTLDEVRAITRQLRTEGDMNARRLAEQIEQAANLGATRAHL